MSIEQDKINDVIEDQTTTEEEIITTDSEEDTTEKQNNNFDFNKPITEMSDDEVEAYAASNGWTNRFHGENKKTAREFAEGLQNKSPALAERNKKLATTVVALEKSVQRIMEDSARTIALHKRELERREKEAAEQKREAKENLDTDKLEKAIKEEAQIQREKADLENIKPPIDPQAEVWFSENMQWLNDPVVGRYADSIAMEMRESLRHLTPVQRLEKVKQRVMQDMPERFTNKNQQQAPKVQAMTRQHTPEKSKPATLTVSTLPKEYKDDLELIMKSMHFRDDNHRKKYISEYINNVKTIIGSN